MHVREDAEVADTLLACFIKEGFYAAEILDPQGHRGVFEQASGIGLAGAQLDASAFALRDVLH
jgi:hypothetical protein